MNYRTLKSLRELYDQASKHSGYQQLPSQLANLLKIGPDQTRSRMEKARLDFILRHVDIKGKTVLDIGANTGFFSFELIDRGAKSVTAKEGNNAHALFIKESARMLNINNIHVDAGYFTFDNVDIERYDIVLCMNVLHHIGDDFGEKSLSMVQAKARLAECLNALSQVGDTIVLQLGFNWKGDIQLPLFRNGTKEELVNFIKESTRDIYSISSIGIATLSEPGVTFEPIDQSNIERDDNLGEFLNRPLFILSSKKGFDGT